MFTIYGSKSNRWRESYNPLAGLTLTKLIALLGAGERGQYADLQWLYFFMEQTDPMIFSILQRRRAALLDADWDIRRATPEDKPIDETLAAEQALALREAYDRLENFREAMAFLFTGIFRGFAHLEKHFSTSGTITRLEPVEQWFWVRDGHYGQWEYNQDAVSGRSRGQPTTRENFVIHEGIAINRMLAVLFIRRNLSQKDWDSYLEVFGIPSVFLVGPPNTSETKEKEFQTIAEELIADGRGYLPNGSDLKYVTGGGGKPPFRDHLDYLDRQITLVGTGGLLTMLSESGSGTLAGGAHANTFTQVARGDAVTLSEVMQRDFDRQILATAFPGKPVLAYFEFAPTATQESARVIEDAGKLAAAGLVVDPTEISEKTGLKLTPAPQL